MTVSPEKIAEMLAAAEKATPGPRERYVIDVSTYRYVEDAEKAVARDQADADFNALCDPQTITDILTELVSLRSQLSGMTEEASSDPSMWATVVESEYDGSLRWDCRTEGDMGDGDSLPTITLAADTFPAGTKLEIKEP